MLEQARSLETDDKTLAAAQVAARDKPRLLVIDDDNLHRMIICRVADRAGYAPAGAATYEEAAKLVREAAFNCITLDLSLGLHAGVEMLHHLRLIGCRAPIVVISGCGEETCRETVTLATSLGLNVRQSMSKPVDLAALRSVFERLKGERDVGAVAAA